MSQELREDLEKKTDQELQLLATANGLSILNADRQQIIEILILASTGQLPKEGEVGGR